MTEPSPSTPPLSTHLRSCLSRLIAPQRHPILLPLVAVALALLVCFIAIWLTGKDPVAGYQKMFMGGLGTLRAQGDSSTRAAILTLTGLSVAVAFSAGLFNIGGEGQLVVGAIAAAFVGQAIAPGSGLIHLPLALGAAMLAGALLALGAAWLKVRRGVHEVISTILLNWIAIYLVEGWLVTGPLRAQSATGHTLPGTAQIAATAELPRFFGLRSDLGFAILLASALALAVWIFLGRTWRGFELRACGDSPETARASGIPVARRVYLAMAISGACAGLAGALIILGMHRQYPAMFRTGYGFDGIAISLIGGNHPLGVLGVAAFFGIIRAGGTSLQLLQIHRTFPELIQGLALLFVAGKAILAHGLLWLRVRADGSSADRPDPSAAVGARPEVEPEPESAPKPKSSEG
ncbi:MAG: ABC transporter permease [Myxococcales bacterium]|jgi:simple sugar transport system permease protein|nr:ABC transporter permease [Myxococcales bacterium]